MITLDEAIEILSRPKTMKGTPQDILEAHDMAITALRQPEIIHCKDCYYRYGRYCHYRYTNGLFISADHYCGFAKRQEDDK